MVISKSFDTCKYTVSELIVHEAITRFAKEYDGFEKELKDCLLLDDLSDVVEAIDEHMQEKNLFVFMLCDEFQCVYKNTSTGTNIVKDLARWNNTQRGTFHCIVTGSSSNLRKLVYGKLFVGDQSVIQEEYPAYEAINLNSTKLQPHWIHPLVLYDDIGNFLNMKEIALSGYTIEEVALASGGRPGLILEVNEENILENTPFSLMKSHADIPSPHRNLLYALVAAVEDVHGNIINGDACVMNVLTPVSVNQLERVYSAIYPLGSYQQEMLFDLADVGIVIYKDGDRFTSSSTVSFASIYTYFRCKYQDV